MLVALLTVTLTFTTAAFGDSITVGGPAALSGHSYIKLLEQDFGPIDNRAKNGSLIASQVYRLDTYPSAAKTYFWLPGFNDMRSDTNLEEYEY